MKTTLAFGKTMLPKIWLPYVEVISTPGPRCCLRQQRGTSGRRRQPAPYQSRTQRGEIHQPLQA